MSVKPETIWTTAAVLLGFQLAAFTWRLDRELRMASSGEVTWVPLADVLNLVAFVVVGGGVFVLPALGVSDQSLPQHALGLGVVILALYLRSTHLHYLATTSSSGPTPMPARESGAHARSERIDHPTPVRTLSPVRLR